MNTLSTKKLRVAIIGAGYVSAYHIAALRRLDFVEIVGLCDLDLDAARALAARFAVEFVTTNPAELLSRPLDAVYVLTPPSSHCALTLQALDAGCHVFVEKPMAESVTECDTMIKRAREKNLVLSVDHSDHFDPVIMRALQLVQSGACGEVMAVDMLRSSDYPPYAGGPLPGMVRQGSYPFRDLGVHGLYVLESFLGEIERLDASYRSTGKSANLQFDEWQATAHTKTGTGRLLLSWNVRPMQNRLIVHCTNGVIEADRFLQICRVRGVLPGPKFIGIVFTAFINALRDVFRVPWNVLRFATKKLKPSPGIQRGAEEFARALHEGRSPPITAEAGRRPIELMEVICLQADAERTKELDSRIIEREPIDALITGAAGFLGGALVTALLARGQRVRVLLRKPLSQFSRLPGVQVVIGDLGDPRIVDHAIDGAHTVYHVGAAMKGGPRDFEAGTVWGTRNVVDACIKHSTQRLVYVSSLSVLDHAGRDPAVAMVESSRFEPYPEKRGAYTQTKLTAEAIVSDAARTHALPAVILRPGQIVGPGAERVTPNGTLAIAGRWIAVGDAAQTLPLVYVDDVVDALLLAADIPQATGQIFNVVDPEVITQGEYLQRLKRKLGPELRLMRMPTGVFMLLAHGVEMLGKMLKRNVPLTRYRVRSLRPLANFDISAAHNGLGWQPRVGLRRGLDRMFSDSSADVNRRPSEDSAA
jgi:predicted dehydrogenase/nucleoside-diphosphate-sugar epimerase